jgi:hypothetical protein
MNPPTEIGARLDMQPLPDAFLVALHGSHPRPRDRAQPGSSQSARHLERGTCQTSDLRSINRAGFGQISASKPLLVPEI